MKKSLALFAFALGILSLGFAETASAQQWPGTQCESLGGKRAYDTNCDKISGTFDAGVWLDGVCAPGGRCCLPSGVFGDSNPLPAPETCTGQTCLNTPDAYCGSYARTGYIESPGVCASGKCYIPGAGGTCATKGGICISGLCSQQNRRTSSGTCIGPDAGKECCTVQTYPSCSGVCRNTSCDAGESVVTGASCQGAYDVCCAPPVAPLPGQVTGPAFSDYQLLEQIPGSSNLTGRLDTYLKDMYIFVFWTVGIAVVFMLTIGGFMYLTSAGNTSRMESAKTVIFDAILGLILALVAWLFLYVINPGLTEVRLPSASITPATPQTPPPSSTPSSPPSESAWPSDATERTMLPANVTVNRANCTTLGQSAPCTSLAGTAAIGAIQALSAACGGCLITITGGTECWLHGSRDTRCNGTHHKPGDYAIDFAHALTLDNYIRGAGTVICTRNGRAIYQIKSSGLNAVFWDEDTAHWHVNFNNSTCSGI